jgi:hypothetical protein
MSSFATAYGVPGTMGPWPDEPGLPYDISPPALPNYAPPFPFAPLLPLPQPLVATVVLDPIQRLMAAWVTAKARRAEARDALASADEAESAAFAALTQALAAAREPSP